MRAFLDSSESSFYVFFGFGTLSRGFGACTSFCSENLSTYLMISMVVKGRRRDTAWYSVIHDEWKGGIKEALEKWLSKENFDEQGKQVKKLEEIREGLRS